MHGDVLLESALHHLRVVRNRVECEHMAQKAEEAFGLEAVSETNQLR
jgi:hypothetical protein